MKRTRRGAIGCFAVALCIFGVAGTRTYSALSPLNGKWGYIDLNGEFVVEPRYDFARPFNEGRGAVCAEAFDEPAPHARGRWGFVDRAGNEVVPAVYALVGDYSEGRAMVLRDGKWGFIDKEGAEVVPCRYDSVRPFEKGLARVMVMDRPKLRPLWGMIDGHGNEVVAPQFRDIEPPTEGLVPFRIHAESSTEASHWGYLHTTGEVAIAPQWDGCTAFQNDLASMGLRKPADGEAHDPDMLWGVIDSDGAIVIAPRFSAPVIFRNEHAVVAMKEPYRHFGVIGLSGEFVIGPFSYRILPVGEELFFVYGEAGRRVSRMRTMEFASVGALYNLSGEPLTDLNLLYRGISSAEESPMVEMEHAGTGEILYFDMQGNPLPFPAARTDSVLDRLRAASGLPLAVEQRVRLTAEGGTLVLDEEGKVQTTIDYVQRIGAIREERVPIRAFTIHEFFRR